MLTMRRTADEAVTVGRYGVQAQAEMKRYRDEQAAVRDLHDQARAKELAAQQRLAKAVRDLRAIAGVSAIVISGALKVDLKAYMEMEDGVSFRDTLAFSALEQLAARADKNAPVDHV